MPNKYTCSFLSALQENVKQIEEIIWEIIYKKLISEIIYETCLLTL